MEKFICKVQRQAVVGQAALVLIYNQDRSVVRQEMMEADDVNRLFERGEYKNYRECQLIGKRLHIGNRVENQSW